MGAPPQVFSMALGIGQAASGIAGQKASAKAQAIAQKNATKAELRRYQEQTAAARINQRFQMEQQARQLQVASTQAMKARAAAKMIAGNAGVEGNSVDALLNDFSRQEATYRFALNRQSAQQATATELRLRDMRSASYNNLLGINKPIEQPNYGEAIFGAASTGLNAYNNLSSMDNMSSWSKLMGRT